MPGKLKLEHLCRLTSGVWPAVVGSLTHLKEQNTHVMFGNGNGANVIICSDDGYKISLHEIMVRRYTRLFDQLDPKTAEDLRDPFGDYVFILHSVDCQTLGAMADLLYTGECGLTSVKARHDLESLLAKGVEATDVLPADSKDTIHAMLAENGFHHFKAPFPSGSGDGGDKADEDADNPPDDVKPDAVFEEEDTFDLNIKHDETAAAASLKDRPPEDRAPKRKGTETTDQVPQKTARTEDEAAPKEGGSEDKDETWSMVEVHSRTVDVLSQMTLDNVEDVVASLAGIELDSDDKVKAFATVIYEMAVNERGPLEKFGQLCKHFSDKETKGVVSFRKALTDLCQSVFGQSPMMMEGVDLGMIEEIVAAGAVEEWSGEDADFEQEVLKRYFGNARLVAELYNTDFLDSQGPWTARIIHECVNELMERGDNASLECLCILLRDAGLKLAHDTARMVQFGVPDIRPLDSYFHRIGTLLAQAQTSDRVTLLLLDLVDWKNANID